MNGAMHTVYTHSYLASSVSETHPCCCKLKQLIHFLCFINILLNDDTIYVFTLLLMTIQTEFHLRAIKSNGAMNVLSFEHISRRTAKS